MYIVQKIVKETLNDNVTKLPVAKSIQVINTKTGLRGYLEDTIAEIKSTLTDESPYNLGQLESAPERLNEWFDGFYGEFALNHFSDINIVVTKLDIVNRVVTTRHELFNFESIQNYVDNKLPNAEYYAKFFAYGLTAEEFNDVEVHKRRFANADSHRCNWNSKEHNEQWLNILRSLANDYLLKYFRYKDAQGNNLLFHNVIRFEGSDLALCVNNSQELTLVKAFELDWTQNGIFNG